MLKNKTILWLLALNVLVLMGLGVKRLLAPGVVQASRSQALEGFIARSEKRGVLGSRDLRRVFEISRSVTVRRAVTDAELDELLRTPDRSPGGNDSLRDVASMYALGALTGAKRFSAAQASRLSPFLLARLDDAEHHPVSAPLAMVFAFKAGDGASISKVRELAKSPSLSIAKAANDVLQHYKAQG